MKNSKKGFTIVELVIVIAVIAILAAVLIPTFSSVISKANESAAMQEAKAALAVLLLEKQDEIAAGDTFYFYVYDKAATESGAKVTYVYKVEGGNIVKQEGTSVSGASEVTDLSTAAKADISNKIKVYKVAKAS